jgi:PPOX class probable F420-dependent enzyme
MAGTVPDRRLDLPAAAGSWCAGGNGRRSQVRRRGGCRGRVARPGRASVRRDSDFGEVHMAELTDAQRAFIRDNAYYAVVTTLRADGSPHSTVAWATEEDGEVLINTAFRRAKARNLERDPRASVVVLDAQDGYRWVAVSGPVALTTEGANEDIERLSWKYDGHAFRPLGEGEVRVTARVSPEHVTSEGL